MQYETRQHSSRIRTTRFGGSGGSGMMPLLVWCHVLSKGGEGAAYQRVCCLLRSVLPAMEMCCLRGCVCAAYYGGVLPTRRCVLPAIGMCPSCCGQTNKCKKNTFPKLHWRVVIMQNIFTPTTSKSGSIFLRYNDSTELSIDLKYIQQVQSVFVHVPRVGPLHSVARSVAACSD